MTDPKSTSSRAIVTGKTTVLGIHPPTAMGLCYVWWPSVAGGFITLAILALAATRNGRRLIGEFPLPRMTTRRLMIAAAVIAIEAVLIINVAKSNRMTWDFRNHRRLSRWPPHPHLPLRPPYLGLSAGIRSYSIRRSRNGVI